MYIYICSILWCTMIRYYVDMLWDDIMLTLCDNIERWFYSRICDDMECRNYLRICYVDFIWRARVFQAHVTCTCISYRVLAKYVSCIVKCVNRIVKCVSCIVKNVNWMHELSLRHASWGGKGGGVCEKVIWGKKNILYNRNVSHFI
jgi:hypothetical protein